MLPPWLLTAFYVVSGVAVVYLLVRIWRRGRESRRPEAPVPAARRSAPPPPTPQSTPADPLPPPTPQVAATPLAAAQSVPTPAVNDLTILKAPAAAGPAAAEDLDRPSLWADGPNLLADRPSADADRLPRVLAESVPATSTADQVFGGLTPALAELLPDSEVRREEARKELQAAGYYQPHALQNFAAIRYLLMMSGLVLAGVTLILVPQRYEWLALAGVVAAPLLGWALPRLYLRGQAAERRSQIERGMPDLLDMLNMCVSQGLTIPDSLKRILRDLRGAYPALAQELRIVTEQASIGNLHLALQNFSARIDIPEVHSFTSLLIQTERMGTSISDALASYSDTMRESLRQRADEKGNRATFRLLFPTVLCLMPAVYIFLLGPAIVELSNFYSAGGRAALDQGSSAIQRLNTLRRLPGNAGQQQ